MPFVPSSQSTALEDVKQLLGHTLDRPPSNTCRPVLAQRQRQVAQPMEAALGG